MATIITDNYSEVALGDRLVFASNFTPSDIGADEKMLLVDVAIPNYPAVIQFIMQLGFRQYVLGDSCCLATQEWRRNCEIL